MSVKGSRAVVAAICLGLLAVSVSRGGLRENLPSETVSVDLKNRSAEKVLALVRPHIRMGKVSVSGSGQRVIVRGIPSAVAEVLSLIDAADQPQRQLLVTVVEGALRGQGMGIGTNPETQANAPDATGVRSNYRTRPRDLADLSSFPSSPPPGIYTGNRTRSRFAERIPVLEGEWASVFSGPAVAEKGYPVEFRARRDLRIFIDATSSDRKAWLSVRATLLGDKVTVELEFVADGGEGSGTSQGRKRATKTTVIGHVGHWILVSPSRSSAPVAGSADTTFATESRSQGRLPIWVRVDEMGG